MRASERNPLLPPLSSSPSSSSLSSFWRDRMTRLRVVVVAVASAVARHQEAAVAAAAFVRPMPNAAQTPPAVAAAAANFAPRVTPLFVRDQFQRERPLRPPLWRVVGPIFKERRLSLIEDRASEEGSSSFSLKCSSVRCRRRRAHFPSLSHLC